MSAVVESFQPAFAQAVDTGGRDGNTCGTPVAVSEKYGAGGASWAAMMCLLCRTDSQPDPRAMLRRWGYALISLFESGSIFTVIRVVIAVFLQLCQGVGTMQQLSPVRNYTSLRCAIQLEYL